MSVWPKVEKPSGLGSVLTRVSVSPALRRVSSIARLAGTSPPSRPARRSKSACAASLSELVRAASAWARSASESSASPPSRSSRVTRIGTFIVLHARPLCASPTLTGSPSPSGTTAMPDPSRGALRNPLQLAYRVVAQERLGLRRRRRFAAAVAGRGLGGLRGRARGQDRRRVAPAAARGKGRRRDQQHCHDDPSQRATTIINEYEAAESSASRPVRLNLICMR